MPPKSRRLPSKNRLKSAGKPRLVEVPVDLQGRDANDRVDRARHIHDALTRKEYPSAVGLGDWFGVTADRIQRDVKWMKLRGLPIEYCSRQHGYFYTRPDVQFAEMELTEGEMIALALGTQLAVMLRGSANEASFASASAKLVSGLQTRTDFDLSKMGEYMSISTCGLEKDPDMGVAGAVRNALFLQREITFVYRKPDKSEKERVVQPLHIRSASGLWYLICWDVREKGIRIYTQKRMSKVRRTGERFERRPYDEIHAKFRHGLDIFGGDKPQPVRLRFRGYAAEYVPLKHWHESERVEEHPDGTVLLTMQLVVSKEVERFILQWGEEVFVEGPPELVAAVRARYRAADEQYDA